MGGGAGGRAARRGFPSSAASIHTHRGPSLWVSFYDSFYVLNVLKIEGFWPQLRKLGTSDGSDKRQGVVLLLHFIYDLNEKWLCRTPLISALSSRKQLLAWPPPLPLQCIPSCTMCFFCKYFAGIILHLQSKQRRQNAAARGLSFINFGKSYAKVPPFRCKIWHRLCCIWSSIRGVQGTPSRSSQYA